MDSSNCGDRHAGVCNITPQQFDTKCAKQTMVECVRNDSKKVKRSLPLSDENSEMPPPFSYINQQFCITSHPLKKVIITESTREVLFLQTDWCQQLCMATTAPPPLPQQRSRRLRGQKPLSPSRRQVEEEWSGASPTPPSGGSPLSGAPPSPSTDDARSGSPGSHSPPPPDSETEQTDLLSLRRDYHRAATQVMMSSHHLEFL